MKRVQFPQDFFCTQTWPPIHCFVHKYGRRDVMWKRSIVIACLYNLVLRFLFLSGSEKRGTWERGWREVLSRFSEKHINRKWTPFPLICYKILKFVLLSAHSLIKIWAKSLPKEWKQSTFVRVPFLCNPMMENVNAFCLEIMIKHFLVSTWIFLSYRVRIF